MIGVRDFAVIRMRAEPITVRFGWVVRAMWIIQVQPQKKRAMGSQLKPVECMRNADLRWTLHHPGVFTGFGVISGGKRVVIEVEPSGQTPALIEHKSADHGAGGVALSFEDLRHSSEALVEGFSSEILDPI